MNHPVNPQILDILIWLALRYQTSFAQNLEISKITITLAFLCN